MMRLFNIKSRLSCLLLIGMMCCTCFLSACKDENVIEIDGSSALKPNTSIESINTNVKALRRLIEAKQLELDVKSYNPVNNGASYTVELSDGTSFSMYAQIEALGGGDAVVYSPKIGAKMNNGDYYWTVDNEWLTFDNNEKVKVINEGSTVTPVVGVNGDRYWELLT